MKRRCALWGIALLVAAAGFGSLAQDAMTILALAPGVTQLGAGATGISIVAGAETLYYNAAGLADLTGAHFTSIFASHLGEASYSAFAVSFGGFAIGFETVTSGSIQGFDEFGAPTEVLSFGNTAFRFGFGLSSAQVPFLRFLPQGFAVGGQLKGVTARLGEDRGSGFSFDLALRMAFAGLALGPVVLSEPAIGVTASNLFGSMSYDAYQEALPLDLGFGASARVLGIALVALDVHTSGNIGFGVSYAPVPTLALRLGILSRGAIALTAGVGLDVQGILVDYAFVSNTLGGSHRVGLTLDFSSLDMAALGRTFRRILP